MHALPANAERDWDRSSGAHNSAFDNGNRGDRAGRDRHREFNDNRRDRHDLDRGWGRNEPSKRDARNERQERDNRPDRDQRQLPRHQNASPDAASRLYDKQRDKVLRNEKLHNEKLHNESRRHADVDNKRFDRIESHKHRASYRHSYHGQPKYRLHQRHRYVYYRTPWYSTRYLAPIHIHYHPVGHHIHVLPVNYISIYVSSLPYFYYEGIYYRSISDGYVVVEAPIGALVAELPVGYVAFNNGYDTYFYVNATYYRWSDSDTAFVVVKKPKGADEAIKEETEDRLYAYPNANQSEEQQAKDRYECHQWAVSESHVDPTLEDEKQDLSTDDVMNYRRALAACLEGRDYTVK